VLRVMKYKRQAEQGLSTRGNACQAREATGVRGGRFACSGRRLPEKWGRLPLDGLGGAARMTRCHAARAMSAWTIDIFTGSHCISFLSFLSLHPSNSFHRWMGAFGCNEIQKVPPTTRLVTRGRACHHGARYPPAASGVVVNPPDSGIVDDNRSPAGPN